MWDYDLNLGKKRNAKTQSLKERERRDSLRLKVYSLRLCRIFLASLRYAFALIVVYLIFAVL
jgi:hypothetical protein